MKIGSGWIAGVVAPLIFIVVILEADTLEGPKTAFVGVLAVVPMLSAVFGTPAMTALVSVITLISGYLYGLTASDGNVAAQNVRLIIIALVSIIAIVASFTRRRMQIALIGAQVTAARAETVEQQANTDSMTGLLNRRGWLNSLPTGTSDVRSIAVIDCDKLKTINDTYGHLVGDEYIIAIAQRLSNGVSRRDLVARWGGDEFLVFISAPIDDAKIVVERLIAKICDSPIATTGGSINATVTAGVTDWPADEKLDAALLRADTALYAAKADGRGKLAIHASM